MSSRWIRRPRRGQGETRISRTDLIRLLPTFRGIQEQEGGEKAVPLPDSMDRVAVGSVAADISNAVVHLLSEYTGRGPTRARTHIHEDLVTIVLHDTLTKGERSLVAAGKTDVVLMTRKAYQNAMKADLIAAVERCCGRKVDAFLSENHIEPDIAIESFVLVPIAANGSCAGAHRDSASSADDATAETANGHLDGLVG